MLSKISLPAAADGTQVFGARLIIAVCRASAICHLRTNAGNNNKSRIHPEANKPVTMAFSSTWPCDGRTAETPCGVSSGHQWHRGVKETPRDECSLITAAGIFKASLFLVLLPWHAVC